MNIKVFTERKKPEEPEMYVKLTEETDGVVLEACDKHGVRKAGGYILKLTSGGEILLYRSLGRALGFKTEGDDIIVVKKEKY